jgi:hypothetical protein
MIIPAGNAIRKYAMNIDESTNEDSSTVRLKTLRKCGIRIGSRLWTKPQKKNNDVTKISGNR